MSSRRVAGWVFALALAVAVLFGPTARARAEGGWEGFLRIMGYTYVVPSVVVFGSAELFYAAQGRWLPRPWAWTQIFVGGSHALAGAAFILAERDAPTGVRVSGYVSLTLAAWFVLDGILSLALGSDDVAAQPVVAPGP